MKRSRFSEEQIIWILKEHEAGVSVSDLCRKHGVSDAGIYKWRARFGGLEVSEAKRLRALEDENAKLKRMPTRTALAAALIAVGSLGLAALVRWEMPGSRSSEWPFKHNIVLSDPIDSGPSTRARFLLAQSEYRERLGRQQ